MIWSSSGVEWFVMENRTHIYEGRNPILPHKPPYVNSGNLNSYTKPHFLGFLQTTKPSKPPYKTYKNIGVFGSNHIVI
jgi:hypothetical protein